MKPYDPTSSRWRKRRPITTGCVDYFFDALLEVAYLSWVGNQKHNPGEPMHWARGKSVDQADTIGRHLGERGGFDEYDIINEYGKRERVRIRHSVALAWRALANLQEELEREEGRPPSRASRFPENPKDAEDARLACASHDPADFPMAVLRPEEI